MSYSINNHHFAPFQPLSGHKEARHPVVIEGEKTNTSNTAQNVEQAQTRNSTTHSSQSPPERIIEARPIKESEQLLGAKTVLPARSPLAAFATVAQPALNLGASVDTYA